MTNIFRKPLSDCFCISVFFDKMNQERCGRQIGSSNALPAQVPLTNMFSYLQMSNEKKPLLFRLYRGLYYAIIWGFS